MHQEANSFPFLEVGISTLNEGLYKISFNNDFDYLVIHQVTDGNDYDHYKVNLPKNVRYIRSDSKGLSKSRNLALANAKAKYLWIMDDDVKLVSQAKRIIVDLISSNSDCGLHVMSHSDCYSNFSHEFKSSSIGFFDSFKVSSIDMIIDVEKLKGIEFDEEFGLGTEYPSGEEFIFTNSVLKRGIVARKYQIIASIHPPEASGLDYYSTPNKLRAKLLMLVKVSGRTLGAGLYLLFLLKKMPELIRNRALINVFKSFLG